jgi:hypothetical protein
MPGQTASISYKHETSTLKIFGGSLILFPLQRASDTGKKLSRHVCPPTTSLSDSEYIPRRVCPPTTIRRLFENIKTLVFSPTTSWQHNIIRGSLNFVPIYCTGGRLKIFGSRYVLLTRAVFSLKIFRCRYVKYLSCIVDFNYLCRHCISKYKYASQ